jgi:CRISPR system Cascade subunit CasD
MPTSLALCFDAPMQSWGIRSHGTIRDTTTEPTKSGVVGLLAAALGAERENDELTAELAALDMTVRVDREGLLERDYHTTQNVPTTLGTGHRTVVSERYYLADALFLVILEGDRNLLQCLHDAVAHPHWPLYFGRRAFVPTRPLLTTDALRDQPAVHVVEHHPWLETQPHVREAELRNTGRVDLRTVADCPPHTEEAELRHDLPISFTQANRRFGTRTVLIGHIPLTNQLITAGGTLCS